MLAYIMMTEDKTVDAYQYLQLKYENKICQNLYFSDFCVLHWKTVALDSTVVPF